MLQIAKYIIYIYDKKCNNNLQCVIAAKSTTQNLICIRLCVFVCCRSWKPKQTKKMKINKRNEMKRNGSDVQCLFMLRCNAVRRKQHSTAQHNGDADGCGCSEHRGFATLRWYCLLHLMAAEPLIFRRDENIFIFSLINGCKLVIDPHRCMNLFVLWRAWADSLS